jgi:predicted transposase YbfD/YdcC
LGPALGLTHRGLPHRTTYGRILAKGLEWADLERVASEFLAQQATTETAVVISLDGKTLRGTIPAGETRGVHLLAAYLPEAGVVLLQVDVGTKENEIPAAARVLELLDLNGKIVRGDAMFTQRGLSAQIVDGGGEYVWTVKDNQPQLRADIVAAFTPPPLSKGFSAGLTDFQSATTVNKGHGRTETRRLTTTSSLKEFLDWPGLEQVFQLERTVVDNRTAQVKQETVYGLTSLRRDEADPRRLLDLVRVHWGIENGLHYRRDVTFHEDACGLESNPAQRILATINNLVLGLLLSHGIQNVPSARRHFNARPQEALALLVCST